MRPEIPDNLEQRITEVCWDAGYQTTGEFVREATRRHVADLEDEQRHGDAGHLVFEENELDSPHHRVPVEFRIVMSRNGVELDQMRVTHVNREGFNWFHKEEQKRVKDHLTNDGTTKLSFRDLNREFEVDPKLTWKRVDDELFSVVDVELIDVNWD